MTERTYTKPDFLCIGYEKSATTWIYDNLRVHPEVALPPWKELRYFNEGEQIPAVTASRRFTSTHWHYQVYRQLFRRQLAKLFRHPWQADQAGWYWRYLLFPHTDGWYSNLFDRTKVAGDITPTYTWLGEHKVMEIRRKFPGTKIIVSLREPTSRIWSKVKMVMTRYYGRRVDQIDSEHALRVADGFLKQDPPYSDAITLWTTHFDKVLVVFFDDVKRNPHGVMSSICKFLGCSEPPRESAVLRRKSFGGPKGEMDVEMRRRLIEFYKPDVGRLAQTEYGKHPRQWLEDYKVHDY